MTKMRPKLGKPRADGGELTESQKDLVRAMSIPDGLYRPEPEVMRLKARYEASLKNHPKGTPATTTKELAKICGISSETVAKIIGKDLRAIDYILDKTDMGQQEMYLWNLALKRMENILLLGDDKTASSLIKVLAEVNRRMPDKSPNFAVDASQNRIMQLDEASLRSLIQARSQELGLLEQVQEADVVEEAELASSAEEV